VDIKNRHPLILLEGMDNSGKSSLANKLTTKFNQLGISSKLFSEPVKDNNLRDLILSHDEFNKFGIKYDLTKDYLRYYLFHASRAKVLEDICLSINSNMIFLDRSYISTMVYQYKLNPLVTIMLENEILYERISRNILRNNFFCSPDLILFLDINTESYISRFEGRKLYKNDNLDLSPSQIDKINFNIESYRFVINELKNSYKYNIKTIDANQPEDEVLNQASEIILNFLSICDSNH
jgi:thymidylate kinase